VNVQKARSKQFSAQVDSHIFSYWQNESAGAVMNTVDMSVECCRRARFDTISADEMPERKWRTKTKAGDSAWKPTSSGGQLLYSVFTCVWLCCSLQWACTQWFSDVEIADWWLLCLTQSCTTSSQAATSGPWWVIMWRATSKRKTLNVWHSILKYIPCKLVICCFNYLLFVPFKLHILQFLLKHTNELFCKMYNTI